MSNRHGLDWQGLKGLWGVGNNGVCKPPCKQAVHGVPGGAPDLQAMYTGYIGRELDEDSLVKYKAFLTTSELFLNQFLVFTLLIFES